MPRHPDKSLALIRQRLLEGMVEFMHGNEDDSGVEWDCGYTQQHIDRCAVIIDQYLAAVESARPLTDEQIRAAVKQAVLDLNDLNDECDGALIETDQREDLCQLFLVAARQAGLDTDQDITEEWRDW
jgi:hypothetical protein